MLLGVGFLEINLQLVQELENIMECGILVLGGLKKRLLIQQKQLILRIIITVVERMDFLVFSMMENGIGDIGEVVNYI